MPRPFRPVSDGVCESMFKSPAKAPGSHAASAASASRSLYQWSQAADSSLPLD